MFFSTGHILSAGAAAMIITVSALMIMPAFGKTPSGSRQERISHSPNFRNGKFHNLEFTPDFSNGYSMKDIAKKRFTVDRKKLEPAVPLPSFKTDLRNLPPDGNILVWFGHSSYFLRISGKRFLIDPVLSGKASPLPGGFKSYAGTDPYTAEDIPEVDFLILTHDHYDHLDHRTFKKLKNRIGKVICGLGTGQHLEQWGFDPGKIIEKDWNESFSLDENIMLHTETARHFSGRSFARNKTLWMSYVLETPELKIYIGGDSGYGKHFAEIGKKHGGFDLVILENGQYNEMWANIHMFPEEVLKAAKELKGARLFPVHSGKFTLSFHRWDEPLALLSQKNSDPEYGVPLVMPVIGEIVDLDDSKKVFSNWWEKFR